MKSKLTITIKTPKDSWWDDDQELILNVDQWLKLQEIEKQAKPMGIGSGIAIAAFFATIAVIQVTEILY